MTRTMIDIEELKKNAERFRVAAICASDLTYEWNSKTGQLEWFGDIEKALGIKNEDFPKDLTGWLNLIHPDDREKVTSTVENQIKRGGSMYFECRIKHKTRKWANFRCRSRIIEGDNGKPEKLIGMCTDVTNSKRTEKYLRESEAKYRLIYDKSPLGIFYFSKEGVIITCNNKFGEILGVDSKKMIGFNMLEKLKDERMREALQQCLSGRVGHFEGEYVSVSAGKDTIVKVIFSPILTEDGVVENGIGIAEDITERVNAVEKLRQAEKRHRMLLEGQKDMVFTCTLDGQMTYCSPNVKQFGGYDPEEVVGHSIGSYITDGKKKIPGIIEVVTKILSRGETAVYELMYQPKNGRAFPVEAIVKSFEEDNGSTFIHGIIRDIRERKREEGEQGRLQAKIRQTQRLETLGVLVGGIAHDFNNLLVAILGNVSVALSEVSNSSPVYQQLLTVEEGAKRAGDLVRYLLTYSGESVPDKKAVNLNLIIKDMFMLLQSTVSKKINLISKYDDSLSAINGDISQIRQIILNLVVNSSDAIEEKQGVITLSTGSIYFDGKCFDKTTFRSDISEGKFTYFQVSDTGCGINEETKRRMFEPFYTTKALGRGLGMAIVLGIIKGHNGAIRIESEPGKGSTIRVLFPSLDRQAIVSETVDGDKTVNEEEKIEVEGTILVIDDIDIVLSTAERMLSRIGFDVITASSAREGIRQYKENKDSILGVILDFSMPDLDGEETFNELRKVGDDLRVIISSGYSEKEILKRFEGDDRIGFLKKPYSLSLLREKTREFFLT